MFSWLVVKHLFKTADSTSSTCSQSQTVSLVLSYPWAIAPHLSSCILSILYKLALPGWHGSCLEKYASWKCPKRASSRFLFDEGRKVQLIIANTIASGKAWQSRFFGINLHLWLCRGLAHQAKHAKPHKYLSSELGVCLYPTLPFYFPDIVGWWVPGTVLNIEFAIWSVVSD